MQAIIETLDTPFPCTGMGKLAIRIAVNTVRWPLTRKKRVGYQAEWLCHYHVWLIMVAFYKTTR